MLVVVAGAARSDASAFGEAAVQRLTAAVSGCRVVDARWSEHVRSRPPVRCDATGRFPGTAIFEAAQLLAASGSGAASSRLVAARALALAVLGERDAALRLLEAADLRGGAAPAVYLMLSALHLEQAPTDPLSAARAYEAASHALRLWPASAAASFNRAIALDALRLPAGDESLGVVAEREGASDWGSEARRRRATATSASDWRRVSEAMAAGTPVADDVLRRAVAAAGDGARELVEDVLLPQWARDREPNPERARIWMDAARRVASAVREIHGDLALDDLVRGVAALSGARAAEAAAGVLAGREARAAIDRGEAARAMPALATARRTLSAFPSADVLLELYALMAGYYRGEYESIGVPLTKLAGRARRSGYLHLAGRCEYARAAVAYRQSKFAEAEALYAVSADLYAKAGEVAYLATVHGIVANLRREQGDDIGAWASLGRMFALLPRVESVRHRNALLSIGHDVARGTNLPALALHLTSALLAVATAWKNPVALESALSHEASLLARLGEPDLAEAAIGRAHAALRDISDANVRRLSEAEVETARGEIALAAARPCDAIAPYTAAIERVASVADYQLARLLLQRGRAHRRCAHVEAAERDLRRGIEVFETQRRENPDEYLRVSHFDAVWDLFGELIGLLAIDRHLPDPALLVAERGRARGIAESAGLATDLLTVASIQRSLGPGVTTLSYVALDEDLLVWAISREKRSMRRVRVAQAELSALVEEWRAAVLAGRDEKPFGRRLFDLVMAPLAGELGEDDVLLVVPDGPLHAVPFSALWTGKEYLLERHAVWVSPSLGLVATPGSDRNRGSDLAAVGDPAFARDRFPRLARLPDSAGEARAVAALYAGARLLVGAEATKTAVLDALQRADLVHVAAHAVVNPAIPMSSFIVVANAEPGDGLVRDDAAIRPADVAALAPMLARLVVLSGCETAAGARARGEGPLSLARTFLAAGVPQVVANLWDVADATSRELLVPFHRYLRSGMPAASALRAAQLDLLRHPDSERRLPREWAAVIGIGAPSPAPAGPS